MSFSQRCVPRPTTPEVLFITVSDYWFFPGTLATCNSIRLFHPNADIAVVESEIFNEALSDAQRDLLLSNGIRLLKAGDFTRGKPERVPGAWQLKAYAAADLGRDYAVVVGIDSDALLCAPMDDILGEALQTGRFYGGADGAGVSYDAGYTAYGIAAPAHNPKYMSTSLYCYATTARNQEAVQRWADCCDRAVFGPQADKVFPGHGDQGVLNAVLFQQLGPDGIELLPNELWSQHWTYWDTYLEFEAQAFINHSYGTRPQRAIHVGGAEKFWDETHVERLLTDRPGQIPPFCWFLYLLWFGPCRDWGVDPYLYLAEPAHHLTRWLVYFFSRIAAFDPAVKRLWDELPVPFIERVREVRSLMSLGTSMSEYISLAKQVPDGGRIVEIGSYEGGSAVTLAVALLHRDVVVYSVESFGGNHDGTMDGHKLPRLDAYCRNVHSLHPHLRLISVPAPSRDAVGLFADGSIDLVFIDACHSAEAVKSDLHCWLPKVKADGFVAGDDYDWESVRAALLAVFPAGVSDRNCVWWTRRGSSRLERQADGEESELQ